MYKRIIIVLIEIVIATICFFLIDGGIMNVLGQIAIMMICFFLLDQIFGTDGM